MKVSVLKSKPVVTPPPVYVVELSEDQAVFLRDLLGHFTSSQTDYPLAGLFMELDETLASEGIDYQVQYAFIMQGYLDEVHARDVGVLASRPIGKK